jgi:hypothetical protein
MSETISISNRLNELLVDVTDWTIAKIEEGSGFTVLVIVGSQYKPIDGICTLRATTVGDILSQAITN